MQSPAAEQYTDRIWDKAKITLQQYNCKVGITTEHVANETFLTSKDGARSERFVIAPVS